MWVPALLPTTKVSDINEHLDELGRAGCVGDDELEACGYFGDDLTGLDSVTPDRVLNLPGGVAFSEYVNEWACASVSQAG
jgi:hypothetical protein